MGMLPSGKAPDFGSGYPRFDSWHSCHIFRHTQQDYIIKKLDDCGVIYAILAVPSNLNVSVA